MSPLSFSTLIWVVTVLVWVFLLFSALYHRWTRRYTLVLVYIFSRIGAETTLPAVRSLFGRDSIRYTYAYIALSLILVVLSISVLVKIRGVFGRWSLRRDWDLPAGAALVLLIGYIDSRPIWPLFRMLDISFTLLTFVGAATVVRMVRRRREIDLGWNLKMVLLALTLPASFYTLVFATYTMGMDLSYENATYWIQGASLASWIILAAGMSHYSPPRRVGLPSLEAKAVLDGDSSTNQNGSERFAEEECHTGGVSF